MELNFQSSSNITLNHILEKIDHFTFPPVRKKIQTMRLCEPFTGVWALKENKMTGAIFADTNPEGISELFSFFIIPEERNKQTGNKLLALLETMLKKNGTKQIQTRYRNDWGSLKVIERMLEHHGWEPPQLIRVIAEIEIRHYDSVAWPDIRVPSGLEFFCWADLSSSEKAQLETMMSEGKIPREFNPFQHHDKNFLPVSFGMRFKGGVIGWNIVYALKEDTIEYNNLFITEPYRKLGFAIPLLHRSFGEQYKLNIPRATWIINADNTPVMKIAQKIAGSYIDKFVEVKGSRKILQ